MAFVVIGNIALVLVLLAFDQIVTRRRTRLDLLVEHLAALTSRSLPLGDGLRWLAADLGGFIATRLASVARRVEDGAALGDAVASFPHTFPPVVRAMITAGDRAGNLAAFLAELRRSYRRLVESPGQGIYAAIYPILLTVAINSLLLFLHYMLAPRLEAVFRQVGGGGAWIWEVLPWLSRSVVFACALMTLLLSLGAASPHFGTSPLHIVKVLADRALNALPFLGAALRDAAHARFATTSGLLLRSGASLPDAVRTAAECETNSIVASRLHRIARHLADGGRLGGWLVPSGLLPAGLAWNLETGEAGGALADGLLQAGAVCDTRAAASFSALSRLMVPLFVVLNGVIVLAMFATIFVQYYGVIRNVH
jgi:general secretion pathway protein F